MPIRRFKSAVGSVHDGSSHTDVLPKYLAMARGRVADANDAELTFVVEDSLSLPIGRTSRHRGLVSRGTYLASIDSSELLSFVPLSSHGEGICDQ
jgi:hypothetical protein